MTTKEFIVMFLSDYLDLFIVPLSIFLYHKWNSGKSGDQDDRSSKMFDVLVAIQNGFVIQTRILESMKEDDTRVRDNFTNCLNKISEGITDLKEGIDALVLMFREYKAFEKGKSSVNSVSSF